MNRITRCCFPLAMLLFTFACVDREPLDPGVEGGPQAALTEVTGFHFLSPIGKGTSSAGFLGFVSPTVVICQWNAATKTCASGTTLAEFTLLSGTGGTRLVVTPDNAFQVDWNTTQTQSAIVENTVYQVVVLLGGAVLGTADIAIYANMGQARNATGDAFALLDGRTLPIKFGITLDALEAAEAGGGTVLVQTFTTTGGLQTAEIPGEAIFQVDGGNIQVPGGGTEFTLLIVEQATDPTTGECVTSYGGRNAGGCFLFETVPEGVTFLDGQGNPAGIGGTCRDDFTTPQMVLAKEDDGVTTFPAAAQDILLCPYENGPIGGLPRLLRALAQLVLPAPLHAIDLGETGTMGAFSTVFWAEPLEIQGALPAGPFAAGQTIPLSLSVMTTHNDDETPDPAVGVTVEFTATGGVLSATSAVSNALGVVTVNWTLPLAGAASLTANVAGTEVGALQLAAAAGDFYVANFDVDPAGAPIAHGTIVNNTYASAGITLAKVPAGLMTCGADANVYANNHGPFAPWFSGPINFNSEQNNVTICAGTIASDFNATNFGVIRATFALAVPSVCIDVAPTTPGGQGFLAAYDAAGNLLATVLSTAGARETICTTFGSAVIRSVTFAGDGTDLAIFDNLKLVFTAPPPIP